MHCRRAQLLGFRDIKPNHILEKCLHQQVRSVSNLSQESASLLSRKSVHGMERVTKITEQLIKAASRTQILPSSGWKHKKSLRGEEKRLEKNVKGLESSRGRPTKQLAEWQEAASDSALDEMDETQTTDIPTLGTYVDIRRYVTNVILHLWLAYCILGD